MPIPASRALSVLTLGWLVSLPGGSDDERGLSLATRESPPTIAFASHRDGNWEIYVTTADGAHQTRLTTRPDQDRFPLFSPDGTRLAFGSQHDGHWELWVMDADGRERSATKLFTGIAAKTNRQWSPDGSRIAFTSERDGERDIYTIRADGSDLMRLTTTPGDDVDPSWSPDGSRLAFTSSRDGNAEIYVMRADGKQQTRITRDSALDRSPVWSPDGSTIAFVSARYGGREICRVQPDGRGLERLTVNGTSTNDAPAWSPDGSRLAFQTARGDNYDIEVLRLADKSRTRVAATPEYDGMYAWSPDGRRLAFISGRDGYDALYISEADGMRPRRLTTESSLNPVWSP
jgi:Tol biopolymer transport system component